MMKQDEYEKEVLELTAKSLEMMDKGDAVGALIYSNRVNALNIAYLSDRLRGLEADFQTYKKKVESQQ